MSATSSLLGTDSFAGSVALKLEPELAGASGGAAPRPDPAAVPSAEEEAQQRHKQMQDCLEVHISDGARAKIDKLMEQVESLSEMELLLLYLRLPSGCANVEAPNGVNAVTSLHLSNQLEQSQAYTWIVSHLEEHASTCLRKDEVYDDYRSYCENHSLKSLNTADFGKVMKRAFPNVKPRRLGQRGQSKYCYGGLRKRVEVQPPLLPDLNPAALPESGGGGGPSSTSSANSGGDSGACTQLPAGESMLSEVIQIVLEWVEKLLGRQFDSLRKLADYLVTHMYVNTRSCAAFALVADIHGQQPSGTGRQTAAAAAAASGAPVTARRSSGALESRRRSFGAREDVRTPSVDSKPPPAAFPTPPTTRPSSRLPQTPPGPPITAYSAASVRRRLGSPAAPSLEDPPAAPSATFPSVKPNLLQALHTPQPHAIYPPTGHPLRALPPYPVSSSAAYSALPSQPQPPAAHSQVPYQSYPPPIVGPPADNPPPPLQYGGGPYTPMHRGKRPYEVTTQEHYSPYYNPAGSYPSDFTASPKRARFSSAGDAPSDYPASYYQQQQQSLQQQQQQRSANYPQFSSGSYDPYACGLGMLSPRAASSTNQQPPPQQQSQQPRQQPPPQQQQSQQQLLPRLGCSPGPYASQPPPPQHQRRSPFAAASSTSSAAVSSLQTKLDPLQQLPVLPSLPKLPPGRSPSRHERFPRVGRTPSPVRFTSGPPTNTPGLRRPSPLRSSPGQGALDSPESAASIQLPTLGGGSGSISSGAASAQLQRSPGSPFRSLARKGTGPGGPGDEQTVSSTVEEAVGSSSSRRSADLHTPTPGAGSYAAEAPTDLPGDFYFGPEPPGTQTERCAGSEQSPPSAFL